MPVQSGSDRVLQLMKRGYTADDFAEQIDKVKRARPGICIAYRLDRRLPGRDGRRFRADARARAARRLRSVVSFIYSPRPGTPASRCRIRAARSEARTRLERLQALLNEQAAPISQRMVGTVQRVLVERLRRSPRASCRHAPRTIVGSTSSASATLVGQFVDVLITEPLRNSLRGRCQLPIRRTNPLPEPRNTANTLSIVADYPDEPRRLASWRASSTNTCGRSSGSSASGSTNRGNHYELAGRRTPSLAAGA